MARHGVSGATVESICTLAKASTGLIRYHFGGKGKLLAAAYREIAKRFMAAIRTVESLDADESLARLHGFIDVIHDPRQIGDDLASAWFGLWHAARHDADLQAINREWYGEYRAYLTALIDQAARQHGATVDAGQAAYGLIALTDGFWQELMVDPEAFDPELARTISRGYVDRLLA